MPTDAGRTRSPGKELDTESGNDFFGERYYSSAMGRWMSPDLPFADQDPGNPQSWNLYSYVRNNPINSIDNDGLLTIIIPGTWYNIAQWNQTNPLVSEGQAYFNEAPGNVKILNWPSGDREVDRIAGAEMLRKTIADHKFAAGESLNVIAHSNSGNVALAASQLTLTHKINTLITLGTPAMLLDGQYEPNWKNIGSWYNIQASTDWVPILDEDGSATNRVGAHNYTVPTPGMAHFGQAHGALWSNGDVRDLWWRWFLNQQAQSQSGDSDKHWIPADPCPGCPR